jgi:2'-5' RNA ligase superfamily
MPICFMNRCTWLPALLGLAISFFSAGPLQAKESEITAIDIALKPDAVMYQHAQLANAELLKDYPQGFSLDASHNPHITLLQRYVKTADLKSVYDAASQVVRKEKPTDWKLEAFKYYYGKSGKTGLAGIVVKPTPDLVRLQKELIEAVAPYAIPSGDASAFVTTAEDPDIGKFTMEFVSAYVERASGEKFNPHVTTGIGTVATLDKLLAQPFNPFSFSPAGVCVYHLGNHGTARALLKNLE